MKFRIERKTVQYDKEFELPDFSFNHAYTVHGDEIIITYLVPTTDKDRIQAQKSEILAHLLGEYR